MKQRKGCMQHHFKGELVQRLHSYVRMEGYISSPQACTTSSFQWHYPPFLLPKRFLIKTPLAKSLMAVSIALPSLSFSISLSTTMSTIIAKRKSVQREKHVPTTKMQRKRNSRGWRHYRWLKSNKITPKMQPTQGVNWETQPKNRCEVDLIMGMNNYGKVMLYQYRIYRCSYCMDLEAIKPSEMNNHVEEKHVNFLQCKKCGIGYVIQ